jgi:hypothetical protein
VEIFSALEVFPAALRGSGEIAISRAFVPESCLSFLHCRVDISLADGTVNCSPKKEDVFDGEVSQQQP